MCGDAQRLFEVFVIKNKLLKGVNALTLCPGVLLIQC